jgi:hypothetical protein
MQHLWPHAIKGEPLPFDGDPGDLSLAVEALVLALADLVVQSLAIELEGLKLPFVLSPKDRLFTAAARGRRRAGVLVRGAIQIQRDESVPVLPPLDGRLAAFAV